MERESSVLICALQDAVCKLPSLQRPLLNEAINAIRDRDKRIVALQRQVYALSSSAQAEQQQYLAEILR